MALWVPVHGYGAEALEQDILNRPVRELTERTNYLYDQLQGLLGAGTFQSVRILNAAIEVTGATAASVGDFVQLDRATRKYSQAIASVSATDAFVASPQTYAIGILTQLNADNTGTIALYGKVNLGTNGAGWDLNGMVEGTDELFRNGTYHLSSVESGKMTSTPSGIAVYLGQFQEDPLNTGYGGFTLLSPQYRNTAEAHIHRAYPLCARPVGRHTISDSPALPNSTHAISGFDPETAAGAVDSEDDLIPRLVTSGAWTGDEATQYTIWLSNSSDIAEAYAGSSDPSTDWTTVYLHWTSSDPLEPQGIKKLWSFETLVAVGTKGLLVGLEKMAGQDNDEAYIPDDAEGVDINKRTWILDVPEMTCGWLPRRWRHYLADHTATDGLFSFVLYGGIHTSSDNREYDTVTVACGDIYNITYTGQPAVNEMLTVETKVFEFYTSTTTLDVGNVGVEIGADADSTYEHLVDAILAQAITNVFVARSPSNNSLAIVVPASGTLSGSLTNATIPGSPSYTGTGNIVTGDIGVIIYDQYNVSLIDAASTYWSSIFYWSEIALSNGLTMMVIPYDDDGTAATANTATSGDYWDVTIVDEAPTAHFKYATGMHPALSMFYPPVPMGAATLVLNGVELASHGHFPTAPDYRIGVRALHWYSDLHATVPWPRDWVDKSDDGSDVYRQNLIFHLVRMALGDTGVVTSLRPSHGSPIKVIQCGTGEPGTVGDLELDLDLKLEEVDAGLQGWRVVKAVDGQKLIRGSIVEQIQSDGSISITQSVGAPAGQGIVKLSVADNQYAGDFETVSLENAKQEVIGMFPYIRLLGWQTGSAANIPTAFVAKFRVPHTIAISEKFRVTVYATVFGEDEIPWVGGGSALYAGLQFEFTVLPDHVAIVGPDEAGGEDVWNSLDQALPDGLMTMITPTAAAVPFGVYPESPATTPIYKAYDPMLAHNDNTLSDKARRQAQVFGDPFPTRSQVLNWTDAADPVVRAGSLVGIRISRADVIPAGQEYTGAIGFINLRWKLVSVA